MTNINPLTKLSIEYANQQNYLDDLYRVYPVVHDAIRSINSEIMDNVQQYFQHRSNNNLLKELLKLELFPLKDSYIAYLRRNPKAIEHNPQTVNRRICDSLYELGFDEIYKRCSQPKESNRQIGPMFRNWLNKGDLGILPIDEKQFMASNDNAILEGTDITLQEFADRELGFHRNKGLDFIGRFNGKYVIGEAKFITDFGGHQNAQLNDAIDTIMAPTNNGVVKIGIIDGVPYIPNQGKQYKIITSTNLPILSALLLRDFLYSL